MILLHPETLVPSLKQAVSDRIVMNDFWSWRTLDLCELTDADATCGPADLLCRYFNTDSPRIPDSPRAFIESTSCQGLVVWLDGLLRADLDAWADFLDEYDQLARNSDPHYPLLCLPLCGTSADRRFKDREAVAVCSWEFVVERNDTTVYVAEHLRKRLPAGLLRETVTAICAELAGTDGEVATYLSRAKPEDCIAPQELLIKIGQDRKWKGIDPLTTTWHTGIWEQWGSNARLNSVVIALQNDHRELRRRVWRAEVGVIFPFIEEKRLQLVQLLKPHIKLPISTPSGVIKDPADLEIGQLRHYARGVVLSHRTRWILNKLVGIRHALAHGISLDYETLREIETLERLMNEIASQGVS